MNNKTLGFPCGYVYQFTTALLMAGMVLGCAARPETVAPPPPEVTVTMPQVRDVTVYQEFVGTTEAYESVNIRARVQGFLNKMTFTPSSFVHEGELLFVIEPEPYEAQRDRAAAGLKAAEAGLRRADSDLERLEQAVRTNAVSQQEVTRARAERDQASAAMLEAQAALTNAQIQLDYTSLESPIDGLVSRNYVDLGNLVGVGEATLLTTVRRIDPIYAYFEVSERFVAQVLEDRGGHQDPGTGRELAATLLLEETGLEIDGRIDSLENTVDPSTGTIRLRGVFPNNDAKIFPGFFVRVRLPGEFLEGATLVEESALGTDLGGRYLMIVDDDNVVERRYIQPGPLQADKTRVILEGLEPNEQYITSGLQRARPGMPVTPQTAGSGS
ncbi:MAG: efflux RND transporter periplasmic adaptor subunit [bacterium]|nr:efflux RND transporter periplasmic adaptor subunit [bacterium]